MGQLSSFLRGLTCAACAACADRDVDIFFTRAESEAVSTSVAPGAARVGDVRIDDFEDNDLQALATDGWWYVTNDGTSQQRMLTEATTTASGTNYALSSWGRGFTLWGAFIGLDLGSEVGVFDAGWTEAVRFRATSAAEREVAVRFILQDNSALQTTISLRTQWTEYVIDFDDFRFEGDPDARIDPGRLRHFQLFFGTEPFDVRLDDVVLVDR